MFICERTSIGGAILPALVRLPLGSVRAHLFVTHHGGGIVSIKSFLSHSHPVQTSIYSYFPSSACAAACMLSRLTALCGYL